MEFPPLIEGKRSSADSIIQAAFVMVKPLLSRSSSGSSTSSTSSRAQLSRSFGDLDALSSYFQHQREWIDEAISHLHHHHHHRLNSKSPSPPSSVNSSGSRCRSGSSSSSSISTKSFSTSKPRMKRPHGLWNCRKLRKEARQRAIASSTTRRAYPRSWKLLQGFTLLVSQRVGLCQRLSVMIGREQRKAMGLRIVV